MTRYSLLREMNTTKKRELQKIACVSLLRTIMPNRKTNKRITQHKRIDNINVFAELEKLNTSQAGNSFRLLPESDVHQGYSCTELHFYLQRHAFWKHKGYKYTHT